MDSIVDSIFSQPRSQGSPLQIYMGKALGTRLIFSIPTGREGILKCIMNIN